jgi:hypothetical protein
VTVENGGDDAAVDKAESVVVLGTGFELGDGEVAFPVAAEMEAVRVGVAAFQADQVRIQRFLDAEFRAHASSFRSSPTATIALSTSSAHGITLKREQPDSM